MPLLTSLDPSDTLMTDVIDFIQRASDPRMVVFGSIQELSDKLVLERLGITTILHVETWRRLNDGLSDASQLQPYQIHGKIERRAATLAKKLAMERSNPAKITSNDSQFSAILFWCKFALHSSTHDNTQVARWGSRILCHHATEEDRDTVNRWVLSLLVHEDASAEELCYRAIRLHFLKHILEVYNNDHPIYGTCSRDRVAELIGEYDTDHGTPDISLLWCGLY
jgi:hypothetical protein